VAADVDVDAIDTAVAIDAVVVIAIIDTVNMHFGAGQSRIDWAVLL